MKKDLYDEKSCEVGMKIVEINSVNYGSTGNIMLQVARVGRECGICVYESFPASKSNVKADSKWQIKIGSRVSRNIHLLLGKYTGLNGCFSHVATYRFLKKLGEINPDALHLHNLHNGYINLPMLFRWIKKRKIKVVWTLHDCWAFTGKCPYFDMVNCDKWEVGCFECPQYKKYPQSKIDNSKFMYRFKKKWFTGIENLTIVTPSKWLADLVKQSFLGEYTVRVINNGIDLSVFKPTESDLRKKLELEDKTVLLGCATPFGARKGFDVFLKLAQKLDDSFKIILVGLSESQIKDLPRNIIGIERTSSREELAKFYTMADVFVNPTREDNFPTVNIESLACGTPVVTFRTGGSPEIIDELTGCAVDCNDIASMEKEIVRACEEKPYSKDACVKRASKFDMNDKFLEYVNLYKEK